MNQTLKIAIQGGPASFHDMAACKYFAEGKIEISPYRTFRQECADLLAGKVDYAVMAIENSLAGCILPNFALLEEMPITIVGETYLQIRQHLMALPGQTLADIESVRSHPMALHQCSEFLEAHPEMRSVETHDTAESAREIRDHELRGVAAIAGDLAAERYRLEILAKSIENIKDNYTRFLVLARAGTVRPEAANKASLSFHVPHEVGALVNVLSIFSEHSVNLGLIQSVPIPGRPDEYAFHVDLEWQDRRDFDRVLGQAANVTRELHVLGEYKAGERPYDRATR